MTIMGLVALPVVEPGMSQAAASSPMTAATMSTSQIREILCRFISLLSSAHGAQLVKNVYLNELTQFVQLDMAPRLSL
jgi:hypothetical protein